MLPLVSARSALPARWGEGLGKTHMLRSVALLLERQLCAGPTPMLLEADQNGEQDSMPAHLSLNGKALAPEGVVCTMAAGSCSTAQKTQE